MAHKVASRPVPEGETWARSALARLAQVPGVHRAGLALAEGGGRRLLFTASDRDNGRSIEWCEVDAYEEVPLNHTVLTGEAVMGSLDDLAHRYRAFTDRQVRGTEALASIPILAAGHIQGAYALFFDAPQRFDHPQLTLLGDLGARLGADLRRLQRATTHASRSLEAEPVPRGALAATCSVAADPRAIAGARHFVLSTLASWGVDADTVDTAILCLNELVTNAMIHTDGGCEFRVVLDHGVLTTTVRDGGSNVVVDPSTVTVDPLAVHGRGLQLVDAFSTRWGLRAGRSRDDRVVRARAGELTEWSTGPSAARHAVTPSLSKTASRGAAHAAHVSARCQDDKVASESRMVALGFGKFARADRIYALERITGDERGDGRRTRVWIDGVADPLIASRAEVTILRDMGQEVAAAGPELEEALDLAARLAAAADAGRVDLHDLGRRARRILASTTRPSPE